MNAKHEHHQAKVLWQDKPEDHDYPAAEAYLSLVLRDIVVGAVVRTLKKAHVVHYKAKDILRASDLPALPNTNPHVAADLEKIKEGVLLSPVLLVRTPGFQKLLIADGYHRVCASYITDENTDIPCKVVDCD